LFVVVVVVVVVAAVVGGSGSEGAEKRKGTLVKDASRPSPGDVSREG
jgi:hypothetical protein